MNTERIVREVAEEVDENANEVKGHPANTGRSKGIYSDIDQRHWQFPKYTDSIKQREQ
jgi:hypothetical protein